MLSLTVLIAYSIDFDDLLIDFIPIFRGDLEHASIKMQDELVYLPAGGERAEFGDVVAVLFESGDVLVLRIGYSLELLEDLHYDKVYAVSNALL
jgi:hypothetical protein